MPSIFGPFVFNNSPLMDASLMNALYEPDSAPMFIYIVPSTTSLCGTILITYFPSVTSIGLKRIFARTDLTFLTSPGPSTTGGLGPGPGPGPGPGILGPPPVPCCVSPSAVSSPSSSSISTPDGGVTVTSRVFPISNISSVNACFFSSVSENGSGRQSPMFGSISPSAS